LPESKNKIPNHEHDELVKSRIYRFCWIPTCAGMTKRLKTANSYKDRHTREGGYPDIRTTF